MTVATLLPNSNNTPEAGNSTAGTVTQDTSGGASVEAAAVPKKNSAVGASPTSGRKKKAKRTKQDKANRSARRAGWAFLVPFLGIPFALFYFYHQEDLVRTAAAIAATLGIALVLGPFMLWWSISGLRRGAQHLILGILTGTVGALLTTVLLVGIVGATIGWSLIMQEPLPFFSEDFDITQWLFLSPKNPLEPHQYLGG